MSGRRLHDERGAILPIASAAIVLGLVVGALVLDVANWYQHGKTLQIRADSAVLAAGQRWAYPCDTTTNANIEATAREYAGSHMRHPPAGGTLVTAPYNNLITTTSPNDVHVVFNSLKYFEDGGSDWTDRVDPSQEVTGKPCTREYLDAKITEEDIEGFFGRFAGISFLPSLSRKARVAPFEVESLEGVLPVGVKAYDARSGAVLFVAANDPGGPPLARRYLEKDPVGDSPDSGTAPDFPTFVRWTNETDTTPTDTNDSSPASVPMPNGDAEAIVVLSSRPACGAAGVVPPCLDISLPTAVEICNQGDTSCFDAPVSGSPPTQSVRGGISRVEGFNPNDPLPALTNVDPPAVRRVSLEPAAPTAGCRAGGFVYGDAPCSILLVADLRFAGRADADVRFHAYDDLGWCPNNGCQLARDITRGPTIWTTTIPAVALSTTATDGRNPVRIRWRFGGGNVGGQACASNPTGGGNACDGGFDGDGNGSIGNYLAGTPVHQIFASNEVLSGPIEVMRVWDGSGFLNNAVPRDATPTLWVDVFLSSVVATAPGDPPIALRLVGSQNGSIDCDPNLTFDEEFLQGCKPLYGKNTTNTCPAYNVLWSTPQPWRCVKTQTGNFIGEFTKGLEDRVLNGGNTCLASPGPTDPDDPDTFTKGWNWWNSTPSMFPNFDPTDPRLVTLFVTPFGSFQGAGNAIFPIIGFGAFYITGWNGAGSSDDPCDRADAAPQAGFLVGHFIKDVLISGAVPSTDKCNPASLNPCVVALVE